MAGPDDNLELALADLENEPLPSSTRDRAAQPPEDEIEIAHAEDDGGAPPPPAERPAQPPRREVPVEEGVETLRARLKASEEQVREANRRAEQAERAQAQAAGQTQDANLQFLETALKGAQQGINVLKGQLADAYALQDFAAVAELQVEISRAAQRESQIAMGVEQLKATPRQPARAAAPPASDPVERVASQLTPNAAAWVRAHPDYVTDPRLNAKLMAAHYDAVSDGLEADSADYIAYVESKLGVGGAPAAQNGGARRFTEERTPVASSPSRAPPAAPVSRSTGGGASPTRVTLTREQREAARDLFPDEMQEDPTGRKAEQAYARNMLILQREGRLN